MFSAHDILDIAIQLEKNGEKTYRDAAERTSDPKLCELLHWVADEERDHARWFSQLKDRLAKGEDHHLIAEMSRALVEDVVQGQAFSLEEVDFSSLDTSQKMVHTFIGFEEDTAAFYAFLKSFINDAAILKQLEQIIVEENHHIAQFRDIIETD